MMSADSTSDSTSSKKRKVERGGKVRSMNEGERLGQITKDACELRTKVSKSSAKISLYRGEVQALKNVVVDIESAIAKLYHEFHVTTKCHSEDKGITRIFGHAEFPSEDQGSDAD